MTTETLRSVAHHASGEFGTTIRRALHASAAGFRAYRDWDRLNRMSDAQLDREGLARCDLARAVMQRNFG